MDWSIFFGGFVAFLAGLSVNSAVNWWQRRQRAKAYRTVIAVEMIQNLRIMADIAESVEKTRAGGYAMAVMVIDKPHVSVLRSVASASDALLSLAREEQLTLVQLVGQLERLLYEYDAWPEAIAVPRGTVQFQLQDGTVVLAREVVTRQLIDTISYLRKYQMMFLTAVLNNSSEKDFSDRTLRSLYRALEPTRKRWRENKRVQTAIQSPEVLTDEDRDLPLVVWTHGRMDYPIEVVELKTIIEASGD